MERTMSWSEDEVAQMKEESTGQLFKSEAGRRTEIWGRSATEDAVHVFITVGPVIMGFSVV